MSKPGRGRIRHAPNSEAAKHRAFGQMRYALQMLVAAECLTEAQARDTFTAIGMQMDATERARAPDVVSTQKP